MVTSSSSTSAKYGIHLAHAVLALGVAILIYGLKFHGPYSFIHLEGLALSLYGLVASSAEALVLLTQKRHWPERYAEFWNAFLWELHMVLLIATHIIVYTLFRHTG